MIEFIYNGGRQKLTKIIFLRYRTLGYGRIRALLRNKDIQIDDKRVKEDVFVESGSRIKIYAELPTPDNYKYDVQTVYEDENLYVFNKPKGLETQGEISLEAYAKRLCPTACAVHRLDINTDGVILIAKNAHVEKLLTQAISEGKIHKNYLAIVYGRTEQRKRLVYYLKKDADKSRVKIYDKQIPGSLKIITEYETVFASKEFSVVDVNLVTGRTHQIRAQFAYLGQQILGDGKYGKEEINSRFPYKKQALTAYKLRFETDGELAYLNGKTIEIDCSIKDLIK